MTLLYKTGIRNGKTKLIVLNIGVPKEKRGGRDKLGIWDSYIHITIYKLEKQKTTIYVIIRYT